MKKVKDVYRQTEFSGTSAGVGASVPLSGAWHVALGELQDDAKKVGNALAVFPYGSAFKLAGAAVAVFVALNLLNKFGNMKGKLKHLMG